MTRTQHKGKAFHRSLGGGPRRTKKLVVSLQLLVRLLGIFSFFAVLLALWSLQHAPQSQHLWRIQFRDERLSSIFQNSPEALLPEKHSGNSITFGDLDDIIISFDNNNATSAITIKEAKQDKEPILELLLEAGIDYLDLPTLASLPNWTTIQNLYGKSPAIHGLDTCEAFRNKVPPQEASVGPAGMFNSGTNILYTLLQSNCYLPKNQYEDMGIQWQVTWGKHMLYSRKRQNTVDEEDYVNKDYVLPIVVVRDPYTWMQSTCRHPYALLWHHTSQHCPNLVPNQHDYRLYHFSGNNIPVRIKQWKSDGFPTPVWPSMAHLWTDWYQQYFNSKDPRLIVRLEDLIFHPKQVIEKVCSCVGGKPIHLDNDKKQFNYQVDSAKYGTGHGRNNTSLIGAIIKSGWERGRLKGYTKEDLELAHEALDPELMQVFQYKRPLQYRRDH